MTGPETFAGVAVEVFEKEQMIAEVGIALVFFIGAEDGAAPGVILLENVRKAVRERGG